MMDLHSYYTNGPNKRRRKAIPATCGLHRGPIGFANLLMSMHGGTIVLDPISRAPALSPLMRTAPRQCATS
jgi:hypothetical protein